MATAFADYERIERLDGFRRLRRIAMLARMMDTAVAIPFTNIRFGADSVLGLAPGLGDVAGALISLVIVNEARRLGVPNDKLVRMLINVATDTFGGSIPVVGDMFDVYFKSNKRNVDIALDHFGLTRDEIFRSSRTERRGRQ
jgi:hypothetical protein